MSEKRVVPLKDKQDIFNYIMKQAIIIEELREENEQLKSELNKIKDDSELAKNICKTNKGD